MSFDYRNMNFIFFFIAIQIFMFITAGNSEPVGLEQETESRNSKGTFHFSEITEN